MKNLSRLFVIKQFDCNNRDVSAIGVVCQLVDEYGMNKFTLMNGLLKFSKERAPVQE